ncbi:hypothetical protein Q7C36_019772 [Tachysurus vachellii]|uniref:Uncharacterized protein n=1 Tax=Tachysurus vachellii TaxID=175792 RepID=A0AA88RYG1_TACVA|nr:hypothetical protein Q7C36_019772 [Tachysurus vachellii]
MSRRGIAERRKLKPALLSTRQCPKHHGTEVHCIGTRNGSGKERGFFFLSSPWLATLIHYIQRASAYDTCPELCYVRSRNLRSHLVQHSGLVQLLSTALLKNMQFLPMQRASFFPQIIQSNDRIVVLNPVDLCGHTGLGNQISTKGDF